MEIVPPFNFLRIDLSGISLIYEGESITNYKEFGEAQMICFLEENSDEKTKKILNLLWNIFNKTTGTKARMIEIKDALLGKDALTALDLLPSVV